MHERSTFLNPIIYASILNWLLKNFPEVDFRGFWICYSMKNLLSNDTKFSFLRIFSGFTPFFQLYLPDYNNNNKIVSLCILEALKIPKICIPYQVTHGNQIAIEEVTYPLLIAEKWDLQQ